MNLYKTWHKYRDLPRNAEGKLLCSGPGPCNNVRLRASGLCNSHEYQRLKYGSLSKLGSWKKRASRKKASRPYVEDYFTTNINGETVVKGQK